MPSSMKSKLRILVVDDEETCNYKLCTFLRNHFEEVYSAFDGAAGWQMYLKEIPNVIISDINMPKLMGTELVKRIRKIDHESIIILMTAYSDEQQIETIANLQINHYVVKPLTSIKLSSIINKIFSDKQKISKQPIPMTDLHWYDPLSKTVRSNTEQIQLSNKEIMILETLLEHPNEIVTYEMFNYRLPDHETISNNAIKILIGRIRKKVPNMSIKSVYKVGYIFNSPM